MNKNTHIIQPPRLKKSFWVLLWIIIAIFLVFLLGSRFIPVNSSDINENGSLLVKPGNSSTAERNETSTLMPTATQTPTAKPTSTRTPTMTSTPTLTTTPPTSVLVTAKLVSLRTGPGYTFAVVQKLYESDQLLLLGKSNDNTWLYCRTSEGNEGWLDVKWVNLSGVDISKDLIVKTPSPAAPPTIWALGDNVHLRNGPGVHFSSITKLSNRQELLLLGKSLDYTWLYVKTTDGQEGWVAASGVNLGDVNLIHDDYPEKTSPPTETSTPVILTDVEGRWIDIDLSEQTVRAYEGTTLLKTFLVSTGVDEYPTETGQYKIYAKFEKVLMAGFDYYLPDVPYTMFYEGDFSLHGTYWHHNFGHPMSHGCVNMDTNDAKWLYEWSSIGTLVNIHR